MRDLPTGPSTDLHGNDHRGPRRDFVRGIRHPAKRIDIHALRYQGSIAEAAYQPKAHVRNFVFDPGPAVPYEPLDSGQVRCVIEHTDEANTRGRCKSAS